jgi:hypothetical protein
MSIAVRGIAMAIGGRIRLKRALRVVTFCRTTKRAADQPAGKPSASEISVVRTATQILRKR